MEITEERIWREKMSRVLKHLNDRPADGIISISRITAIAENDVIKILNQLITEGFLHKDFKVDGFKRTKKHADPVQVNLFGETNGNKKGRFRKSRTDQDG